MSDILLERIKRRKKKFLDRLEQVESQILRGKFVGGEEDRLWLEDKAVGLGLDICCGDFSTEGAFGIDINRNALGVDIFSYGESLPFIENESLDYILCNYFEVFPSALLVLNEWFRCLKPSGGLFLICRDADTYQDLKGPMSNAKRVNSYSKTTIAHYLYRANFTSIVVDPVEGSLRVSGVRDG